MTTDSPRRIYNGITVACDSLPVGRAAHYLCAGCLCPCHPHPLFDEEYVGKHRGLHFPLPERDLPN